MHAPHRLSHVTALAVTETTREGLLKLRWPTRSELQAARPPSWTKREQPTTEQETQPPFLETSLDQTQAVANWYATHIENIAAHLKALAEVFLIPSTKPLGWQAWQSPGVVLGLGRLRRWTSTTFFKPAAPMLEAVLLRQVNHWNWSVANSFVRIYFCWVIKILNWVCVLLVLKTSVDTSHSELIRAVITSTKVYFSQKPAPWSTRLKLTCINLFVLRQLCPDKNINSW